MHQKEVKSILSPANGMNLYRGCTHGCIYCDSRSTCYQMNHEFEDIEVKSNGLILLEDALKRKRKKVMVGTGAMSDPYLHLEEQLQMTRRSLELIDQYGHGLAIQTKSDLILRDLDLLKRINTHSKCVVQITLTTYDEGLCRILEPNVATTQRRMEVLNILKEEGIETMVWMTPILPFINDTQENIQSILEACIQAKVYGLMYFSIGLTLRDGDRQYYYRKLQEHFPGLKEQYEAIFGDAYQIPSPKNKELTEYVESTCRRHGIVCDTEKLFRYLHTYEGKNQMEQLTLDNFL